MKVEESSLTVGQLLGHVELGCTLIAGSSGLENRIRWAHVSELEDPTRWLQGHELLMTTGLAIPAGVEGQLDYLQRLHGVGVSALAVGRGMHAPEFTSAFFAASEDLRIPIIEVGGGVPFIAISEMVASANQEVLHRRLSSHLRIYEVLTDSSSDDEAGEIVRRLEHVTGFQIWIVTPGGAPLFESLSAPPFEVEPSIVASVLDDARPSVRFPQKVPTRQEDGDVYILPVRVQRRAVGLLVTRSHEEPADLLTLHHVAQLLSRLAGDLLKDREQSRREGSERLARFLYESEQYRPHTVGELFPQSETNGQFVFGIATLANNTREWNDIHNPLIEEGFDHLITKRSSLGVVVVQLGIQTVDTLAEVLSKNLPGSRLGLSAATDGSTDLLESQRQARWALRSAVASGEAASVYLKSLTPQWLPMESSGLELVVQKILGPILRHDLLHGTDLLVTLSAFLEEGRSWKSTADRLFVHRQTLIGRIKRVEELTGRRLSSTEDVCDLWLALKAQRVLEQSGAAARED